MLVAARVAPAWAWRLGPSGGCGKRGRGAGRRGAFRDLGLAQRRAARASAVARVRRVVRSWAPRRVAGPRYVAAGPRAAAGSGAVTGAHGSADASSPDPAAKKAKNHVIYDFCDVTFSPQNFLHLHRLSELRRRQTYLLRRHTTDGDGPWGIARCCLSSGLIEAKLTRPSRVARGEHGQKRQYGKVNSLAQKSRYLRIAATPNLSPSPPLDARSRALGNR